MNANELEFLNRAHKAPAKVKFHGKDKLLSAERAVKQGLLPYVLGDDFPRLPSP